MAPTVCKFSIFFCIAFLFLNSVHLKFWLLRHFEISKQEIRISTAINTTSHQITIWFSDHNFTTPKTTLSFETFLSIYYLNFLLYKLIYYWLSFMKKCEHHQSWSRWTWRWIKSLIFITWALSLLILVVTHRSILLSSVRWGKSVQFSGLVSVVVSRLIALQFSLDAKRWLSDSVHFENVTGINNRAIIKCWEKL